jgi:hypothetical protein
VSGWVLVMAVWSFDRVEPPWAVLINEDGEERVVQRAQLPAEARPGDRLATPTGPVVGVQRVHLARLKRRLDTLCRLAGAGALRQRRGMRPHSTPKSPAHSRCRPLGSRTRPAPR